MADVAFEADDEVMARQHHLSPLIIQRKRFVHSEKVVYRVYKGTADYVLVEADSAYEAIQKSGVETPLRVQREQISRYHALESQLMQTVDGDLPMATDVAMPESSEVVGLVYQGMFDGSEDAAVVPFEGMSFADLTRKKIPKAAPVEVAVPVVQAASVIEEPVAAEPTAIEEESDVLTPEEVERLLRG